MKKELTVETKKKRTEAFYRKAIEKAKIEIGKKYNNLTILDIDYDKSYNSYFNNHYHRIYVTTQCSCGFFPSSNQLNSIKSGHIKSCGCSKFNNPLIVQDLTGKTFGRLTVIKRDLDRDLKSRKEGKKVQVHWLCKCSCGNPNLSSVVTTQLLSGKTQSCGCYASEQIAKRNKIYSTKQNICTDNNNGTMTLKDEEGNCVLLIKKIIQ